jgi:hypothetical protein
MGTQYSRRNEYRLHTVVYGHGAFVVILKNQNLINRPYSVPGEQSVET